MAKDEPDYIGMVLIMFMWFSFWAWSLFVEAPPAWFAAYGVFALLLASAHTLCAYSSGSLLLSRRLTFGTGWYHQVVTAVLMLLTSPLLAGYFAWESATTPRGRPAH